MATQRDDEWSPPPGSDGPDPTPPGAGTPHAPHKDAHFEYGGVEHGGEIVNPGALARLVEVPGGPAKRIQLVAFDDYIMAAGATTTALSPGTLDWIIGSFDQLALHVVADDAARGSGDLQLSAQILHSGDGIHWLPKSGSAEVALTTIYPSGASSSETTVLNMGYDDGTRPTLAFVSIQFTLTTSGAGPIKAHVKAHLTCNDRHERVFANKLAAARAREEKRAHDKLLRAIKAAGNAAHQAQVDRCHDLLRRAKTSEQHLHALGVCAALGVPPTLPPKRKHTMTTAECKAAWARAKSKAEKMKVLLECSEAGTSPYDPNFYVDPTLTPEQNCDNARKQARKAGTPAARRAAEALCRQVGENQERGLPTSPGGRRGGSGTPYDPGEDGEDGRRERIREKTGREGS